ncbi:MAG: hypothetical protein JST32_05325 [Bacteroidetes bacterium]|nr:hypothetical protein [Bacteroidota bacterium]
MKGLFSVILLVVCMHSFAQLAKSTHPFRTIRTLVADLNNDSKPDTIKLMSSIDGRNNFNKISITLNGYITRTFKARDYWTVVDSEFLVKNKNAVHTKLLFLKKTTKHSAILLFGEIDGAGYRGEFSIINIENNYVKMVFDPLNDNNGEPDIEYPVELSDLEHNGRLCFVYTFIYEYGGFSNESNRAKGLPDIGAYHPYLVYAVNDSCRLNKPLSKKYMEDNYVFAGYKYSEKINILYPRNGGKPTIWKKKVLQ